jgi:predicted dehydrogenase
MGENRVIESLGRRLRLAVIGGGPGSFIGGVHRQAARTDDCYELVTGVFSSKPETSQAAAREFGISPDRIYTEPREMLEAEAARDDGAEVVAIMTPNDTHHPYTLAALEHGFHVICDKPITNTLAEAREVAARAEETGRVFCLTHNYTGYPMVRQARAMIEAGELGAVRLVQVEYVQGGNAQPFPEEGKGKRAWRQDPRRGGPSLVLGDIGTHAHNLLRFTTGLEVTELSAEVGAIVPGRSIHDYAAAMLRLDGGARGVLWATQAAAGVENSLAIRISGEKGSLEWQQEIPQRLTFKPLQGPVQVFSPNGPGVLPLAARASRIVKGHPEGFPEAFANLYRDAAEAVAAAIAGGAPPAEALVFPTAEDGVRGMEFVEASLRSSSSGGGWVKLRNGS